MPSAKGQQTRPAGHLSEISAGSSLAGTLRQRFGLSRMEAVVACSLADGLTYEEIADRCCISYHTVHSHVSAIHRKVGVSSNARLLALIRKEGWG
jgi:DNA-binding CsgD family transcriptional regulator